MPHSSTQDLQGLTGTARTRVPARRCIYLLLALSFCAISNTAADEKAEKAKAIAEKKKRNAALLTSWREACIRVREGDPWGAIAQNVKDALDQAGPVDSTALITRYLTSLRAAHREGPKNFKNRTNATPQELVKLLRDSRLLNEQSRLASLISAPLHTHTIAPGVMQMHWDQIGDRIEHDYTDPSIRIYKRGRVMVPVLIDALGDMTATRCTSINTKGRYPGVVFRRCDLAMALLEAITRCRFHAVKRGSWFSHMSDDDRDAAAKLAAEWWKETSEMPRMEARSWLISRIRYHQAKPMIALLDIEGDTALAVEHLKSFLVESKDTIRMAVVKDLAAMGDRSGIDLIVERRRGSGKISENEAAVLLAHGDTREGKVLRELLSQDRKHNPKGNYPVSKAILSAIADNPERPMVIAVLAVLLDPEDKTIVRISAKQQGPRLPKKSTRADIAAAYIQHITQRDFRYDPFATKELRRRGIERVRDWWEREGRGLHGFKSAGARRRGGIR